MDASILSVTTGHRTDASIRVGPSATIDLLYACYFLRHARRRPSEAPPWAHTLLAEHPDVVDAAVALFAREEGAAPLMVAFGGALEGGYAWDATPERFLADLPRVARGARELDQAEEASSMSDELRRFLEETDPDLWSAALADVLRTLWSAIEPYWLAEGRPAAEAAALQVEARLQETGDVVRALPPHHFAQFEALADELRAEAQRGPLWIFPMALSPGGGVHLSSSAATAVGFGLQTETVHARTEAQVEAVARRAKALSDPTRLMLLSLLARYPATRLTVGDLARQLGVSQPTVSGHLKILREAGLVTVTRRGNRSLPALDEDAVRDLLDALGDVLHRPEGS